MTSCETNDELAVILSHEMSHAILDHVAEKLNQTYLFGYITLPVFAVIWAFMPSDLLAIAMTFLYNQAIELTVNLPYSRKLENEADEVSILLFIGDDLLIDSLI